MKNLYRLFNEKPLAKGFILIAFFIYSALANSSYKETIKQQFWGDLYKDGGKTYYCNKPFASKTPLLSVSHIYSGPDIREHLQCGTNRQCLRDSTQYQIIMSDLQNVVPANAYFEFKRKNAIFGILDESVEANECDIRKRHHVIEPPSNLKGDIARVIFYMHQQYELPLSISFSLLNMWHQNDPPSEAEIARNAKVKAIQGNDNPFIATPSLVSNFDH